jgi:hypothetical protein
MVATGDGVVGVPDVVAVGDVVEASWDDVVLIGAGMEQPVRASTNRTTQQILFTCPPPLLFPSFRNPMLYFSHRWPFFLDQPVCFLPRDHLHVRIA